MGTSAGATTSTRRKPTTKVAVACDFCRGKHIDLHSVFVLENLIEPPIGISARNVYLGIDSLLFPLLR